MTIAALPVLVAATAIFLLLVRRAAAVLLPAASPLRRVPSLSLLVAVGLAFVPMGPLLGWQWFAGVLHHVAVPTLVLLADAVWREFRPGTRWLPENDRRALWLLALAAAAVLYPLSLGLSRVDPYEWGWRSPAFDAGVAIAAAALILAGRRLGIVLALALLACRMELLESTNLWDYLIDPLLVAMAGWWAARALYRGGAALVGRARGRVLSVPSTPDLIAADSAIVPARTVL